MMGRETLAILPLEGAVAGAGTTAAAAVDVVVVSAASVVAAGSVAVATGSVAPVVVAASVAPGSAVKSRVAKQVLTSVAVVSRLGQHAAVAASDCGMRVGKNPEIWVMRPVSFFIPSNAPIMSPHLHGSTINIVSKSRHCKAAHVGSSVSPQHRELTAPVSSVVFMLPSMAMRPPNTFVMTHCKNSPCAGRGMLINAAAAVDRRREGLSCMVDRNM
mmetsp:Transcript_9287/g.13936  ORF Transcript_9287/g.13936 Transcript_9287/m.13936 type:complete len:216 (-) Transcript_9287:50-697(-)